MRAIGVLIMAVLMLVGSHAMAAPPERELDPKVAVKLIAQMNEIREDPIAIASLVEGTMTKGAFEASHVRRVTAIHPVPEDGSRVRRARCYDFMWNETYGWFVSETRAGRGGDEVWIWSETKGEIVVK